MRTLYKSHVLLSSLLLILCLSAPSWAQSTKARTFNGTSDNLQSASSINLSAATTISVSVWVWFNSHFTTQMWLEMGASSSSTGDFAIFQGNGDSQLHFQLDASGGASFCNFSINDPSSGTWHHYLFVLTATSCAGAKIYLDGVSQSLTFNSSSNGTTYSSATLNVMARNAASFFTPGRISDIAIWTTGLTSGNATTLAACGNPQTVNGTPAFYWPINQTSPEVATDGGVNLNVTGTTNSASNCPGSGTTRHTLTLTGVGK